MKFKRSGIPINSIELSLKVLSTAHTSIMSAESANAAIAYSSHFPSLVFGLVVLVILVILVFFFWFKDNQKNHVFHGPGFHGPGFHGHGQVFYSQCKGQGFHGDENSTSCHNNQQIDLIHKLVDTNNNLVNKLVDMFKPLAPAAVAPVPVHVPANAPAAVAPMPAQVQSQVPANAPAAVAPAPMPVHVPAAVAPVLAAGAIAVNAPVPAVGAIAVNAPAGNP